MKKILLLSLAIFSAASFLAIYYFLPSIADKKIQRLLRKNCESCEVKIGRSSFGVFPARLVLGAIEFKGGSPEITQYTVKVDSIQIDFSVRKALKNIWDFSRIWMKGVDADIVDGDSYSAPRAGSGASDARKFRVRFLKVTDGRLVYHRHYKKTRATLRIDDINGSIDDFGNGADVRDRWVKIEAQARLEKTGKVFLRARSPLFKRPAEVDVYLRILDQNLEGLTPFFRENAGITLEGRLYKGESSVFVNNNHLNGWVFIKYDGFHLGFIKNFERNAVSAFFMNLGSSLGMDKDDTPEARSEQRRRVEIDRLKRETLVSFLLRGMKLAALNVALAPEKK